MPDHTNVETLRIPSSLNRLPDVDEAVERIAGEMGFDANACADLGICVTEAAGNAIVHAHHEQPDLTVEVRFERLKDALRVSIRDHGPGFDVETVPDPTLPENLLKDNGRGLHLIRSLMDEVDVRRHPDGMQITMTKRLH